MSVIFAAHLQAGNEVRKLLVEEIRKADSAALLRRGWSDYDVESIDGEGALRVARIAGALADTVDVPRSRLRKPFKIERGPMARMIPAVIDPATRRAPASASVFGRLRDDPGTADWIVLHSFNLPRTGPRSKGRPTSSSSRPVSECCASKSRRTGGSAARRRRALAPRRDTPPVPRSPFKQAEDNMRSLLDVLRERRRPKPTRSSPGLLCCSRTASSACPRSSGTAGRCSTSRDLHSTPGLDAARRRPGQGASGAPVQGHRRGSDRQAVPEQSPQRSGRVFEVIQSAAQRRDRAPAKSCGRSPRSSTPRSTGWRDIHASSSKAQRAPGRHSLRSRLRGARPRKVSGWGCSVSTACSASGSQR